MLFVVIIERRKKDSSSYEEFCVATMLNSKFGVTLFSCAKEIENYGFWDKLINKISFKKHKFVVRAKHFANSDVSSKHHISNVSLPQDSFDNNMRKYGIIKVSYSKTSFIGIFTYRDPATSCIGKFCFSSSHHSVYIMT